MYPQIQDLVDCGPGPPHDVPLDAKRHYGIVYGHGEPYGYHQNIAVSGIRTLLSAVDCSSDDMLNFRLQLVKHLPLRQ